MDERGRDALLKPRIGVGAGIFTYFGDVNDNNYAHIFTSSPGFEFVASHNISRYFMLDLKAFYGHIGVNERSKERNLNFQSTLFSGGLAVTYNFNHLYKKKPGIIQPYFSLGFSYINFNSKTDLLDANGNQYHYWADGSIRDAAESVENFSTAQVINRDYKYETDLREMNNDGLGKYDEFTFAFPISLGVDFRLSRRMSAKLGTTFYPTLTDLIDDISTAGEGVRKGNSSPDMFLFSSFSVSYSLGMKKPEVQSGKSLYFEPYDFYALQTADSDSDGVNDFDDLCALTPQGVKVDAMGCPLDDDTDVIENFRDDEAATAVGSVVDLRGVALNDSTIEARYTLQRALDRTRIAQVYPQGVLDKNAEPPMTDKDQQRLAEAKALILESAGQESKADAILKKISEELAAGVGTETNNVDEVVKAAQKVTAQPANKGKNQPKFDSEPTQQPMKVVKQETLPTSIPDRFRAADYDNDGIITPEEITRTIDLALEGKGAFDVEELYDLIDFYQDKMADVRVVNFGGTKGVYIDNQLNILKNFKGEEDKRSDNQRFLANKFKATDFNKDGIITADEVQQMINLFDEGNSPYSEEMMLELIDLFFED